MKGTQEKNLVPSEKKLVNGKREVPLGTALSEKIDDLLDALYYGPPMRPNECYNKFIDIVRDMFALMHHHRYGVLYNVLKKFI